LKFAGIKIDITLPIEIMKKRVARDEDKDSGTTSILVKARRSFLVCMSACFLIAPRVSASELKPETLKKWDEYIQASSLQMRVRLHPDGHFLWVDEEPERGRAVRAGEILVSPVGKHVPHSVTSGLVHHWVGAAFIPDAKTQDVLGVVRDYGHYKTLYKPHVVESKALVNDGSVDKFSISLLTKEGSSTLALDSDYEACYVQWSPKQWYGIAYTTRAQEIRNYGHPDEHKLPEGQGNGYIWRVYNIVRFEERDGGVYVEQETIALSRDIPALFHWIVDPIVRRVSRNALTISLRQTEEAVQAKNGEAGLPVAWRTPLGVSCHPPGPDEPQSTPADSAPQPPEKPRH
jgi:hypothetical protein